MGTSILGILELVVRVSVKQTHGQDYLKLLEQ